MNVEQGSQTDSFSIKPGPQSFQTEAMVPFCLWNWLHFDLLNSEKSNRTSSLSKQRRRFPSVSEIDFILICKKVTKIKSGLQLLQMEAAVNQFFVVLILPPQSFCSIWRKLCQCRSETKWRLQINSNYFVIKTELFGIYVSRYLNLKVS